MGTNQTQKRAATRASAGLRLVQGPKFGLEADPKSLLFRSTLGRTGELSDRPMRQQDAHSMIRRYSATAGIATQIGNHSFRATGITEYLRNFGKVEVAYEASARPVSMIDATIRSTAQRSSA